MKMHILVVGQLRSYSRKRVGYVPPAMHNIAVFVAEEVVPDNPAWLK